MMDKGNRQYSGWSSPLLPPSGPDALFADSVNFEFCEDWKDIVTGSSELVGHVLESDEGYARHATNSLQLEGPFRERQHSPILVLADTPSLHPRVFPAAQDASSEELLSQYGFAGPPYVDSSGASSEQPNSVIRGNPILGSGEEFQGPALKRPRALAERLRELVEDAAQRTGPSGVDQIGKETAGRSNDRRQELARLSDAGNATDWRALQQPKAEMEMESVDTELRVKAARQQNERAFQSDWKDLTPVAGGFRSQQEQVLCSPDTNRNQQREPQVVSNNAMSMSLQSGWPVTHNSGFGGSLGPHLPYTGQVSISESLQSGLFSSLSGGSEQLSSSSRNQGQNSGAGWKARRLGVAVPFPSRNLQLDARRQLHCGRLIGLAEALATADQERVCFFSKLLEEEANPQGEYVQRLTFYVLVALKLRARGEGHLYKKKLELIPLETKQVAFGDFVHRLPFLPFVMEAEMEMILAAVEGEQSVHIMDLWFALSDWERLLTRLASRRGGAPRLRVTLVSLIGLHGPEYDARATGRILMGMADLFDIPFEWHTFETHLMEFRPSMVTLVPGEAVVVHCGMALRTLPDSGVLRSNPREKMLQMLGEMNPHLVILTDMDRNLNSPFFMMRFKDCLDHAFNLFYIMENTPVTSFRNRAFIEERIFAEELVNSIACEGLSMWARSEKYDKWQGRMFRAGFAALPLRTPSLDKLKEMVADRFPQFSVEEKQGALRLLWKGQPLTWICAFRQRA